MQPEHHLQRQILETLVHSDHARFRDLRPSGVDGNIFTYHLKQLISEGLVLKSADGTYQLTNLGKLQGVNSKLGKRELLEQAHSILLLAVQDQQERWLLHRRSAQPMYGAWGFLHTEPTIRTEIAKTAQQTLLNKTGLTADFQPRGAGYITLDHAMQTESFVQFTLLMGKLSPVDIQVSLSENYQWLNATELTQFDLIPSTPDLLRSLNNGPDFFFAELRYNV